MLKKNESKTVAKNWSSNILYQFSNLTHKIIRVQRNTNWTPKTYIASMINHKVPTNEIPSLFNKSLCTHTWLEFSSWRNRSKIKKSFLKKAPTSLLLWHSAFQSAEKKSILLSSSIVCKSSPFIRGHWGHTAMWWSTVKIRLKFENEAIV